MAAPPVVSPRDAWPFARLLIGAEVNGELAELPDALRPAAAHLAGLVPEDRQSVYPAMAAALGPMGDALILAVSAILGTDPRPEAESGGADAPRRPATLADLRPLMNENDWTWPSWMPGASVFGIGGFEGTGKTRFALDLARRAWLGEAWPDGSAATLPPESRTLWLCSDGQQDEIAVTAAAFGLPDDALAFATLPTEPYGGTSLDDPDTLALMAEFMGAERFAFVVVDSLTYATGRDLNRANETMAVGTPLRDLAQANQTPVCLLLHLNKEGGALGRRIQGLTRTLLRLDAPDPEGNPSRLKLWVPKSFAAKPPALGVTMGERGNVYDHDPPTAPDASGGGRPPASREKAENFIRDALAKQDARKATDLCHAFEGTGGAESAFWRARDALVGAGEITCAGKPYVLRLVGPPEEGPVPTD